MYDISNGLSGNEEIIKSFLSDVNNYLSDDNEAFKNNDTTFTIINQNKTTPPVVGLTVICKNSNEYTLNAEGVRLRFYNDSLLSENFTVNTGNIGEKEYWATQSINGIESEPVKGIIEIIELPESPQIVIDENTIKIDKVVDYETLSWYLNDEIIESELGNEITPSASGKFKLLITDENGCSAESNTVEYTNTIIEEFIKQKTFNIENGYISFNRNIKEFFITDIGGKTIYASNEKINLKSLIDGIYVIVWKSKDKMYFEKIKILNNR